jgi:hypothetical protein
MRIIFSFITIIFLISSCRKTETSWDSDWRAPLLYGKLTLNRLVRDSLVEVTTDGRYHLVINRDIIDLRIDELLQIPDTAIIQKVAIALPSINVPAGFNFINDVEEHAFEVDDIQLKKIQLKSGRAEIKVLSPIGSPTYLTLKLPTVRQNGIAYSHTILAPAGTTANPSVSHTVLDLAGYEIDMTGVSGGEYNVLESIIEAMTDPYGEMVTVTNQDSVVFEVYFRDLIPSYARGYFGNKLISDTTTFNLDALNPIVAGAIDLDEVSLNISLLNGLKTSARTKLSVIENTGIAGETMALSHPSIDSWIFLNQATGNAENLVPYIHELSFVQDNSSIVPFLLNLPKQFKIGYAFQLNPWGNVSGAWDEFYSTSSVVARLTADMPLHIGMENLTYCDTFSLAFDPEKKNFSVKEGSIDIHVINSFPIEARLELAFLDENNAVLIAESGLEKIKGSTIVDASLPIEEVKSVVQLQLNEQEVNALKNVKKVSVKAVFDTPLDGGVVYFNQKQSIEFKMFTNISLTTKF